jgi:hypothetical protein
MPTGTVVAVASDCPLSSSRLVDPVHVPTRPSLVGKVFSRASLLGAMASPLRAGVVPVGMPSLSSLKESDLSRELFTVRLQLLQALPATATHYFYFMSDLSVFDCEAVKSTASGLVWEHVEMRPSLRLDWGSAAVFRGEVDQFRMIRAIELCTGDAFCLVVNDKRHPAVFIELNKVRDTAVTGTRLVFYVIDQSKSYVA